MSSKDFVASICTSVNIPYPTAYDEKKNIIVTYLLKRGWFGVPKCICTPSDFKYNRSENPTGPGVYWDTYDTTKTPIYMKYIYPWLNGDLEALLRYFEDHKELSLAEARDLFATSRKYMLPLLEYYDRIRFTRRIGEKRVKANAKP